MGDFLETAIRYYRHKRTHQIGLGCGKRGAGPSVAAILPGPFARFLHTVEAVVAELSKTRAEHRRLEDEAVAAALAEDASKLRSHAEETYAAIRAGADELLPHIENGEPLSKEGLQRLNAGIRSAELNYGFSVKSDAIPEQLLTAESGSKLYPSLVKKVVATCRRDFDDVHRRVTEIFRARFLDRGCERLAVQRAEMAESWQENWQQLLSKFAFDLSDSDHLPIHEVVSVGTEVQQLRISSWNVMEFPCLGAAEPVLNGIQVSCKEMLNTLGYKGAAERQLLLDAMCADSVVTQHADRVLRFIEDSLEGRGADFVLLQELGTDVQARVAEQCRCKGWAGLFSRANGDPTKCCAITAIVSKDSFDEETELEVLRDGKARYFAAARRGDIWIISCHVPLTSGKWDAARGPEESDEAFGVRVVEQIWRRFGAPNDGGCRRTVIAGGDWNAHVHEVLELAAAEASDSSPALSVFAPKCETCLVGYLQGQVSDPIDGIVCFS